MTNIQTNQLKQGITNMSNLTREEQHAKDLAAVIQCGWALEFVKVQTEEICLAAVKQYGYALEHVDVQTEEICLAAVKQNGDALELVNVQTDKICLAAVKENGWALGHVKVQTAEICLAAVEQDPYSSNYIITNAPIVKDLNIKVLDAVTSTGSLAMEVWHTCSTTHCWAGWIVHLAGKEGYDLEEKTDTEFAAKAIFKQSTGKSIDTKNFHTDNETAMEKIKEFAKGELTRLSK
jgi:Fe2+ or Zn2+ uptake regulation protein